MYAKTILASMIAVTLSGGVWAAETSEQSKAHKESATSSTMTESQKPTSEGEKGLSEKTSAESYPVRASKLIDKTIRNPQDEEIGEVDDLVVTQDGQVRAIISVGGFLGLGERLVAVPYDELQPSPEGEEYLTYSASREELEQEPEFKYEQDESGWGMKKEGQEKEKMKEVVQEEKKQ